MTRAWRGCAVLFGAGLVVLAATGRASLFVRPWFAPVVLLTGVLVALVAVRRDFVVSPRGAAALLAPVLVGVALTPAVVGRIPEQAADPSSLATRVGDPANPLVAGRSGPVTLLQILLAEQEVGGVALAGRAVTVVARATDVHRLSRSVIVCCAADAQSVSVPEEGVALPGHGAWVRVAGHLATRGNSTVLVGSTVTRIPTPADPFL